MQPARAPAHRGDRRAVGRVGRGPDKCALKRVGRRVALGLPAGRLCERDDHRARRAGRQLDGIGAVHAAARGDRKSGALVAAHDVDDDRRPRARARGRRRRGDLRHCELLGRVAVPEGSRARDLVISDRLLDDLDGEQNLGRVRVTHPEFCRVRGALRAPRDARNLRRRDRAGAHRRVARRRVLPLAAAGDGDRGDALGARRRGGGVLGDGRRRVVQEVGAARRRAGLELSDQHLENVLGRVGRCEHHAARALLARRRRAGAALKQRGEPGGGRRVAGRRDGEIDVHVGACAGSGGALDACEVHLRLGRREAAVPRVDARAEQPGLRAEVPRHVEAADQRAARRERERQRAAGLAGAGARREHGGGARGDRHRGDLHVDLAGVPHSDLAGDVPHRLPDRLLGHADRVPQRLALLAQPDRQRAGLEEPLDSPGAA
ncbi:MAG: hypothetical protein J3K34DRAFT_419584 [Monoraphidium minutum]|nr:MAG: hypothetical protein J3K34DRAFT_419584 [Monoraphidium minutum]